MDIYKQEKEEILRNTPQLSQYRRKLGDAENETSLNVFTTWQLSFQQLLSNTSEDSAAVKLLRLLAFFDNKDISEWIFIEFTAIHTPTRHLNFSNGSINLQTVNSVGTIACSKRI
jgi:hypothetical protein